MDAHEPLDALTLAAALDAWEADPDAYAGTLWEAFEALCPAEAQLLFQLAQGAWYGGQESDAVLRLVELGLVQQTARLTPMGRRVLASSRGRAPARRARGVRR